MHSNVVLRSALIGSQVLADDVRPAPDAFQFFYSADKLRRAGFVVLGSAAPAFMALPVNIAGVRWLGLAWLLLMLWVSGRLARHALTATAVLTIDGRGITDHRLGLRLRWQDIARVCQVNTQRASVVDIIQRWPQADRGDGCWRARFGWWCQGAFGVPAVTLSMLLLDGSVDMLVDAIATHRPDLLAADNRCLRDPGLAGAHLRP